MVVKSGYFALKKKHEPILFSKRLELKTLQRSKKDFSKKLFEDLFKKI